MKPGIYFLSSFFVALAFSTVLFFNGCSDTNTGPAPTNTEVSYASSSDGLTDGGLQIDSAKIIIKDIRFGVEGDTNMLSNYKLGTHVLYLNMNNSVRLISNAYMPPVTYTGVSFEVHQVTSAEEAPDPDFIDANGRYSLVVIGSYNGVSFKFKSQLDMRQKLMLQSPVAITATGITNITIKFNPYKWFISGGGYLDPSVAVNTPMIDANIQSNANGGFSVFKDTNKDGNPD